GLRAPGRRNRLLLPEPLQLLLPGRRRSPRVPDPELRGPDHDDRHRLPGAGIPGGGVGAPRHRLRRGLARTVSAAAVPTPEAGRPRTVLLTFATVSWQKGSAAQVQSLVAELRRTRP